MANERMYRKNVTFVLAEPEVFASRSTPTAAELNNAALVSNVTCALWEDDTEFTLGDPETDEGLTFCSDAGETFATFDNPTVTFAALRDKDRTANGIFQRAFERLAFPDSAYIAILRIGKDSDQVFAIGDQIKMVAVKTDLPTDEIGSGDNVRIQQAFLANGFVNWNYTVAA